MSVKKINLMPVMGILLLVILYIVSLHYRGFTAASEYEYAIALRKIFPELSGTFLPKLPAAIATLITGALIYLTGRKLRMEYPATASALYLCFPPVWFIGTSASPAPILALLISIAVAGLFFSHKETNSVRKLPFFSAGVIGAAGAAYLAQCGFFNWIAIFLVFMPIIFITVAIRLEKSDDKNTANKKLNRLAIYLAILFIFMLGLLLLPPICRFLKTECPEFLSIYPPGKRLYRPALALLAPLLWLYLVKETEHYTGKIAMICAALGFFMLSLPPSLPWDKLTGVLQEQTVRSLPNEIFAKNPVIFADESTASAIKYITGREVRIVGRHENTIHPDKLKQSVKECKSDVIVTSYRGELEQFLPEEKIKYTLKPEHNLYLFTGEKK